MEITSYDEFVLWVWICCTFLYSKTPTAEKVIHETGKFMDLQPLQKFLLYSFLPLPPTPSKSQITEVKRACDIGGRQVEPIDKHIFA